MGKSLLAMEFALGVTTKTPVLEELDVQFGSAIYIGLEDSRARLAERLKRLTGDRPEPSRLRLFLKWPVLDERGLAKLDDLVLAQQPRTRMVVLDTLALCRPHGGTGYLKDYGYMRQLQRWALGRRLALICVTHLTKNGHKDFAADVAGSMGAFSSCDTLLHLSRPRGEQRAILRVVSRETGERELGLDMSPEGRWRIAPDAPEESRLSPERRAIKDALRAQAPQGPKAVAEVTGLPYGSVRVMMSKMAQAGQIQRVKGGYALPDEPSDNGNIDHVVNTRSPGDDHRTTDEIAGLAPVISLAEFVTSRRSETEDEDDERIH